ncbi:hypothetical protein [Paremcibacter congregatus]|uniref:Uncharacterized protein n=1 Tax=Paremcibacter congregatus TaxID=2043170 RepID=A0A2G4YNR3_9PROT|nr:hypothetical protein [Paremcibacter congregatus]PHZ83933.1 hypothetical protein CRD36_14465 [Paremcibacter congregatus]QDE28973.1 hypothetical protein FIV45_17655 [Paremcibacter congregatus]
MAITTETLIWHAYRIEVGYDPDYNPTGKGTALAHLEIRTLSPERAALPITETGYRSVFMPDSYLDDYDSAVDFVEKWLTSAALTEEWKDILDQARQLSLF